MWPAEIRTERLLLRCWRIEDAPLLPLHLNNWNIARRLSTPPYPYAEVDARTFIERVANKDEGPQQVARAVVLGEEVIGGLGMSVPSDRERLGPDPGLGFWLAETHWGRGYMTEAVRALLAHAFTGEGNDVIQSSYLPDNEPSRRVHAKLGFVVIGDLTVRSRALNREVAVECVRLTRQDFETANAKYLLARLQP